jgi:hypothetical protein
LRKPIEGGGARYAVAPAGEIRSEDDAEMARSGEVVNRRSKGRLGSGSGVCDGEGAMPVLLCPGILRDETQASSS